MPDSNYYQSPDTLIRNSYLTNFFNVKKYGAVGDGVTDDTAAVQAASDAAGVQGGVVMFPATTAGYLISSVTPNYAYPIAWWGLSNGATIFASTDAVNTINVETVGMTFKDLIFDGSKVTYSTGGDLLWVGNLGHGSSGTVFDTCIFQNYYKGVELNGTTNTWFTNCRWNGAQTAVTAHIYALFTTNQPSNIYLNNCNITVNDSINEVGLGFLDGASELFMTNSTIEGALYALLVDPGVGGNTPAGINAINCNFYVPGVFGGGSSNDAVRITAGIDYNFVNCNFSGSVLNGMNISAGTQVVNNILLLGCSANGCQANGVNIGNTNAVNYVQIVGGSYGSNTTSGISISANTNNFFIQDNFIGNSGNGGNGTGIIIASGTSNNYSITGNTILGNTTAISNGATGANYKIQGNLGINDQLRNTSVTNTYTILSTDEVLEVNISAAKTLTFTTTSLLKGQTFIVKDVTGNFATNNCTLATTSGNIDGSSTKVMNVNYQSLKLYCDGTNFWIV